MEENKCLYPVNGEVFNQKVLPIIEGDYVWKGRPPKVSHYKAFCGILYLLRTGCSWRNLPGDYGYWHVIYDRFSRGNERGLWGKILVELQKTEGMKFPEVIIDSATMKVRRHGGWQKGGGRARERPRLSSPGFSPAPRLP